MQLAHPGYLWLFLLFIPLIAWYVWKHRTAYPSLHISTVNSFRMAKRPLRYYGLIGMFVLRMAALACLIIVRVHRLATHGTHRAQKARIW